MSGHHYDDWETREEAATRIARSKADDLIHDQQENKRLRCWIIDEIEKMEEDELLLLYNIAYDIKDYKTFFKVLKELK